MAKKKRLGRPKLTGPKRKQRTITLTDEEVAYLREFNLGVSGGIRHLINITKQN